MHRPSIAVLITLCFAFAGGGCAFFSKSNKDYDEILMPLQTGSVLQRRVQIKKTERREKPEETKKKKKSSPRKPKPEEEPSATPAPEDESTPPADRFR